MMMCNLIFRAHAYPLGRAASAEGANGLWLCRGKEGFPSKEQPAELVILGWTAHHTFSVSPLSLEP